VPIDGDARNLGLRRLGKKSFSARKRDVSA